MTMYDGVRRKQATNTSKIRPPIVEAWRNMHDDEDVALLSDIVPMGFSDAALAAGYQKPIRMSWFWRKA